MFGDVLLFKVFDSGFGRSVLFSWFSEIVFYFLSLPH